MAFKPELAENEHLEYDIDLVISKKTSLRLVLTDRAAYWPVMKRIALTDPVATACVPISDIEKVVVGRKGALGSIIAGLGLAVAGIVWTLFGYVGAPQALIVGGILLSIFGGQRVIVQVHSAKIKLKWTAPLAFGKKVKTDITDTLAKIAEWSVQHAVTITMLKKR